MGLSLPGLPGFGGTTRTPISAWKAFPSRIVVLLSARDEVNAGIIHCHIEGFSQQYFWFCCS
ncbi:hypothetical protein GYH30_054855 [Glycine max]|nr:hypothetical protein GYH30_054855 [Glycine max]